MCDPIEPVRMIISRQFDCERSPLEHLLMKKQQFVMPLLLALVLITGIAGCKSSENSPSSEQTKTEQASTPSPENSADGKKTRSPESQKRREETRAKIKAVLTPEQVKQLDSKM
jgi:hypothetical protein